MGEDRCVAVWLRGHAPKPAADEAIRIQGECVCCVRVGCRVVCVSVQWYICKRQELIGKRECCHTHTHTQTGARLYKYAREAGLSNYSQDELIERLAAGSLPGALHVN